mmetsp:Transcript_27735/g.55537  ORF Transcript_27735/g.55537 Transcript_27735/m.55537 type:complete len:118 (+) Transcript_27735:188-541(+)
MAAFERGAAGNGAVLLLPRDIEERSAERPAEEDGAADAEPVAGGGVAEGSVARRPTACSIQSRHRRRQVLVFHCLLENEACGCCSPQAPHIFMVRILLFPSSVLLGGQIIDQKWALR